MAKRKVNFVLPSSIAQGADAAFLLGEFNNWNQEDGIPLKKQKDGSFKASISLDAGASFQYRYLLNDGRWVNDDSADHYVEVRDFQIENCVVNVPKTAVKKVAASKKGTVSKNKATSSKSSDKDDLTKIEGIGKKIANLLSLEGIDTFAALSKSTVSRLEKILSNAGSRYTMHKPTTWPKQAKLAAAGKMEELKVWQNELKGGK